MEVVPVPPAHWKSQALTLVSILLAERCTLQGQWDRKRSVSPTQRGKGKKIYELLGVN